MTSNGLLRLREHAEAAKSLSAAKAAYADAVAADEALSDGEHPEALEESSHAVNVAYDAVVATRSVERRAFLAYTNPFGVEGSAGMR